MSKADAADTYARAKMAWEAAVTTPEKAQATVALALAVHALALYDTAETITAKSH